jgi:hypothetical protein
LVSPADTLAGFLFYPKFAAFFRTYADFGLFLRDYLKKAVNENPPLAIAGYDLLKPSAVKADKTSGGKGRL